MTSNSYALGDGFKLQATFTVGGVNTDPSTVVFKFKHADGSRETYTYGIDPQIVRSAVGVYSMDVVASVEGQCWYRVEGTGTCIAAYEYPCICIPSQF